MINEPAVEQREIITKILYICYISIIFPVRQLMVDGGGTVKILFAYVKLSISAQLMYFSHWLSQGNKSQFQVKSNQVNFICIAQATHFTTPPNPSPPMGKKKKPPLITMKKSWEGTQSGGSLLPGMVRSAMGAISETHSITAGI